MSHKCRAWSIFAKIAGPRYQTKEHKESFIAGWEAFAAVTKEQTAQWYSSQAENARLQELVELVRNNNEALHHARDLLRAENAVLVGALRHSQQAIDLVMERWMEDVGDDVNKHPLAVSAAFGAMQSILEALSSLTPATAKLLAVVEAADNLRKIHAEERCDPSDPEWVCAICRAMKEDNPPTPCRCDHEHECAPCRDKRTA